MYVCINIYFLLANIGTISDINIQLGQPQCYCRSAVPKELYWTVTWQQFWQLGPELCVRSVFFNARHLPSVSVLMLVQPPHPQIYNLMALSFLFASVGVEFLTAPTVARTAHEKQGDATAYSDE